MKNEEQSKHDQHGRRIEMDALSFVTKLFGIKKVRHGATEILFNHQNGKTFKVPLN
jgi:hypothetical protein